MAFYIELGTGKQISDLSQIDPAKTYVESGTGRQVPGAQLTTAPSAPQTNAPATTSPSTPSTSSTTGGFANLGGFQTGSPAEQPTPSLSLPPISSTGTSSLSDFATALDGAVNLARQKRNALSLGIMSPYQGTVAASDFNGIISGLNTASDNTAHDLITNAVKAATPSYQTMQIGNDTYQVQLDPSGKMVGATKIFTAPQGTTWKYSTFTDSSTGDVYEVQQDPNSGQIMGQQKIYSGTKVQNSNPDIRSGPNGSLYQVVTDENGKATAVPVPGTAASSGGTYKTTQVGNTLYQYQEDPSGQMVPGSLKPIVTNSGSGSGTQAEKAANSIAQFHSKVVPGATLSDGTPILDPNGFMTPGAWKALIDAAPSYGLSREGFIKEFGYLLYSENGSPSPAYGLTPQEMKLIAG